MTLSRLSLGIVLISIFGCATQEVGSGEIKNEHANSSGKIEEGKKAANQYGWDESNCAHIMADGHCAHPTGANAMDPEISNQATPEVPNSNGWNSSNCAHIMADGTCAQPL